MQRRLFIKCGLAGLAALGSGFSAYHLFTEKKSRCAFRQFEPQPAIGDKLSHILYLAALAPSSHNAQPWTAKILSPDQLLISSRPEHWLRAVDPDNRELLLSMGTFCENFAQAAEIYACHAEFNVLARDGFAEKIVAISLTDCIPGIQKEQTLLERRTLRRDLESTPLTTADRNYLLERKNETDYYPADSAIGRQLREIVTASNRSQTERPAVQAELAEWIRWQESDEEHYGTGLTPDTMEMTGLIKWYARHFMDKSDVLSQRFQDETNQLVKEQVQHCAGWLVIRSQNASAGSILQAGRTLESIWLGAKERRIAFHPMTQPLEEPGWQDDIQQCLGSNVQFIIRVGYIRNYPAPVSLRLPLKKILI